MDGIIRDALLGPILTVTTVWNTIETGDIDEAVLYQNKLKLAYFTMTKTLWCLTKSMQDPAIIDKLPLPFWTDN